MADGRKYRSLSLNIILFSIGVWGSRLISFVFLPLYTSVLSTPDYGSADLVFTTAQLLLPLITVNIQDAVLRFSLDSKYRSEDVISAGIQVILTGSLILAIALPFIYATRLISMSPQYPLFLFFYCLFNALQQSLSMYLKAENKTQLIVISGLLNTLTTCVMNIIFLIPLHLGVTGYLLANLLGSVFASALMFFAGGVFRSAHFRLNFTLLKAMVRYSSPLVFGSLSWWVNNASDRYIVTFFCGLSVNGVYAVAYKIPSILSTVQSGFYNAWSVSAITEYDPGDKDGFIGNVYSMFACASFLMCSVILIGNPILARFLYAKEFFHAWCYVPPLLLGNVFNGLALFEGCIFTAAKKSLEVAHTTVLGALINTALNFVLIYALGPLGAAVATMIGYFSIWILRTVHLKSIIAMKVNWRIHALSMLVLTAQCAIALSGEVGVQLPVLFVLAFLQQKSWGKILKIALDFLHRL